MANRMFLLYFFAASGLLRAQFVDTWFPAPDGPVNCMTVIGNELIVGGSFDDVGMVSGHAAQLDTISGILLPQFPLINGPVHVMVSDSNGNWYLGGSFSRVGNLGVSNLVKIEPDGLPDPSFRPEPQGPVYALMLEETAQDTWQGLGLYVGGQFLSIDGQSRRNLAVVDTITGAVGSWDPSPDGPVYALESDAMGLIYVGGFFSFIGNSGRSNLARVDAITGDTPFEFLDFDFVMNGVVRAMKMSADTLFVGGDFTTVNFTSRQYLAAFNATPLESLLPFNHNLNNRVRTFCLQNGELFFGGDFTSVDFMPRNRIACISLSGDSLTSLTVGTNGTVRTLFCDSLRLFAGGGFSLMGSALRKNIGSIDLLSNTVESFDPSASDAVYCIHKANGKLVAGGDFTLMQCKTRRNLYSIDITTRVLNPWTPDPSGVILCLATYGSDLYIGGDFNSIDSLPRSGIIHYTMPGYQPGSMNVPIDGPVRTILRSGSRLYFGGLFSDAGGTPRDNLAAINLMTNTVDSFFCHVNGTVNSIELYSDKLYVGGYFTTARGLPRSRIVRTDTTNGAPDPFWTPSFDDGIYSLQVVSGNVYAGGWFSSVNGIPRNNLAVVNNAGILQSYDPSPGSSVKTLYRKNDTLLAGGYFTSFAAQFAPATAGINVNGNTPIAFSPGTDSLVSCFYLNGSDVFLGGAYDHASGLYHPNLCRYTSQPVVSVADPAPPQSLTIFPNPSNGRVTLVLMQDRNEGFFQIYDLNGKLVWEMKIEEQSSEYDLGFLENGIYMARVITGTQIRYAKILITK